MQSNRSPRQLSERPLGYIIAVVGGLLGGPIGLLSSPALLFFLNQLLPSSENKQPRRFLYWALIGVIGAPLSLALSMAAFPTSSSDRQAQTSAPVEPDPVQKPAETSTPPPPSRPPVQDATTSDTGGGWNSNAKRLQLERSIKENATSQFTGSEQRVASVSCTPTLTTNFWDCNIRFLGIPEPILFKMEVSKDGDWAGQPVFDDW